MCPIPESDFNICILRRARAISRALNCIIILFCTQKSKPKRIAAICGEKRKGKCENIYENVFPLVLHFEKGMIKYHSDRAALHKRSSGINLL